MARLVVALAKFFPLLISSSNLSIVMPSSKVLMAFWVALLKDSMAEPMSENFPCVCSLTENLSIPMV